MTCLNTVDSGFSRPYPLFDSCDIPNLGVLIIKPFFHCEVTF